MIKNKLFTLILLILVGCTGQEFESTPTPTHPDMIAGDEIVSFNEYNDGRRIQREWEIIRHHSAGTTLVDFQPSISQALVLLNLQPAIIEVLTYWRDSCVTWLADNPGVTDPPFHGQPLDEHCQGQVELFNFLIANNGGVIDTLTIESNPLWVATITSIQSSYENTPNVSWDLNGTTIVRADLAASFDTLAIVAGQQQSVSMPARDERLVLALSECLGGCTQFANPVDNGNGQTGHTEENGDGDGDHFDEMDEGIDNGTPDDETTDWDGVSNPSYTGGTCGTGGSWVSVGFAAFSADPGVSTGHILKARAGKRGGTKNIDIDLDLCENTTMISNDAAIFTFTSNTFSTISSTLTGTEADSIASSSYTTAGTLNGEIGTNAVGGGSPADMSITTFEFQVPDAGGGGRRRVIIID